MITPAEAEAAIRAHARPLPEVPTPLAELCGAVLRERIVASRDQPPFDRVMMDGVAIAFAAYTRGRREFRIAGTQGAGAPPLRLADESDCIEVMTGASTPVGCDCVIPVEKITVENGVATLSADATPSPHANIHTRGLDVRAGAQLLEPGLVLGPAEVAVIASNGHTHARASRTPRIIVISTGDELVQPGQPVLDWQIYRSNAFALIAALRRQGFSDVSQDHLPDDAELLRTRLRAHLEQRDVMILSGGVSMGRYDYIPQVLAEVGVQRVFHKIAQRPGKPMWFGVGASGQTVYALPGNPVSTLVCLTRYVLPGLRATLGARAVPAHTVVLADKVEVKAALSFFMPVRIACEGGMRYAHPQATQGSGDFTSLIGADGFVELAGPGVIERGAVAPYYPW